jgi:hypothetical protein
MNENTKSGAMISEAQLAKVLKYVQIAKTEVGLNYFSFEILLIAFISCSMALSLIYCFHNVT